MVHTKREMVMVKFMWRCGYGLRKLAGVAIITSIFLVTLSDHGAQAQRKVNCGLKCFRWQKCMGQISGKDARQNELGNTGILIFNKCVMGECDCPTVLKEAKEKKKKRKEDRTSTTSSSLRTKSRTSNQASSSSSRFRPIIRNQFRGRLSNRRTTTTTTTTTKRPLLRGKLASRFNRPRSISELRASLFSKSKPESKAKPVSVATTTRNPIASKIAMKAAPKRIVFGFSDDKPIQVELDATTEEPPTNIRTDSGGSKDKPFIVMATSVSSSFSSSVGGASRRSDDILTKTRRKGKLNQTRNERRNVFKRFFPKPHFLHRY